MYEVLEGFGVVPSGEPGDAEKLAKLWEVHSSREGQGRARGTKLKDATFRANLSSDYERFTIGGPEVALFAALLPGLTVMLIPLCIPDRSQTEKVIEHPLATATEGSLYRAWRDPRPTEGTALVSTQSDEIAAP